MVQGSAGAVWRGSGLWFQGGAFFLDRESSTPHLIKEGKDKEDTMVSPKPFHMLADPIYECRALNHHLNTPASLNNIALEFRSKNGLAQTKAKCDVCLGGSKGILY